MRPIPRDERRAIPVRRASILAALMTVAVGVGTASAEPVTVAAAGDIARPDEPKPPQQATAGLIREIDPARVLMLGDAQYPSGEYEQFLASYDPSWGAFRGRTAPVPGNHDYGRPRAAGYFRYFADQLSRYGASATRPSEGWYSFEIGRWKIVALNTNCARNVDCGSQRSWLRTTLRNDRRTCELVFAHHGNRSMMRIAAGLGVDVYLNGHKHTYERWNRPTRWRMRQFVIGTGGMSIGAPRPGADAGVESFGVGRFTLRASGYRWAFVDIDGRIRDEGYGSCRAA